jgi:hypothetical protein
MELSNDVVEKRVRAINDLALTINELSVGGLNEHSKYIEMKYFISEMFRVVAGLSDLEEEAMVYGAW